jgi:hypothetical protein
MADIDQHLAYYREFRSQILGDLAEYEAGHRRTSENVQGIWRDTTAETIADLKRRLAKTEQIIAPWEAKKNA